MNPKQVDAFLERFLTNFFAIPTKEKYVLELSFSQIKFLLAVLHNKQIKLADLARNLNLTPASTSEMCYKLVKAGYVKQLPDQKDRRIKWTVITPKGRKMANKLSLYRSERIITLFSAIGKENSRKFIDALVTLNRLLDTWKKK